MERQNRRWIGWTLAVACAGLPIGAGCSTEPAQAAHAEAECEHTQELDLGPEFVSIDEARRYFEQMAEEAHKAVIRHEHALMSLRDDRRWLEPEQRIWMAIATTDTLEAIEDNRQHEREAREQLVVLARR